MPKELNHILQLLKTFTGTGDLAVLKKSDSGITVLNSQINPSINSDDLFTKLKSNPDLLNEIDYENFKIISNDSINELLNNLVLHKIDLNEKFVFIFLAENDLSEKFNSNDILKSTLLILLDNINKNKNNSLPDNDFCLTDIAENLNLGLFSMTPDLKEINFMSSSIERMLGFSIDEKNYSYYKVLRKVKKNFYKDIKHYSKLVKMGVLASVDYEIELETGEILCLNQTGIPIREDDKVTKVVGVLRDITKEKQVLKDLEDSELKFRSLVETANDLIFSLNKAGNFILINPIGADSLSYDTSEMINKHFLEFVNEESKAEVAYAFQEILTSKNIISFEAGFNTKPGNLKIFEIQAKPIKKNDEVNGIVAIGRDITERKNDDFHLKDLNAKLIEANRIISIERDRVKQQVSVLEEINKLKNNFVSNVSHELRTPLASIVGFAETIASDPDLPKEMSQEFNSVILTEGKRLAKLINDILDFSNLENDNEKLKKEEHDIVKILLTVISSYAKIAEDKGIVLNYELPTEETVMILDKDRMIKGVGNIMANSIKFTNTGGRITLIAQDFLHEVEIIISDTGIGIPHAEMPKLFQKFGKVDRPGTQIPGAGFGLVSTKQIVDMHKGIISIKSEVNKGTTVIIRLPKNN